MGRVEPKVRRFEGGRETGYNRDPSGKQVVGVLEDPEPVGSVKWEEKEEREVFHFRGRVNGGRERDC